MTTYRHTDFGREPQPRSTLSADEALRLQLFALAIAAACLFESAIALQVSSGAQAAQSTYIARVAGGLR